MSNIVITDSTVWIDYFANRDTPQTVWLERSIDSVDLRLLELILCEVLQGARNEKQFNQLRETLVKFGVLETGGLDLATASAWNFRHLRSMGITVRKTIDCLIATYCIRNRCKLLHNDRDFDPFEKHLGLEVIRTDRLA